jgi:hypothetical protein
MDWTMIGAVGEILGAVGVILSLAYLARSVQSSADASKQAAAQAVLKQIFDVLYGLSFEPGAAELWARGNRGFEYLTSDEERVRLSGILLLLLRCYEEVFHYRGSGAVDDWAWGSVKGPLGQIMATPAYRQWWKIRGDWFSEEFRLHVTRSEPPRVIKSNILDDYRKMGEADDTE